MESPVVVGKPPEYHGNTNERGFPFDEEEGSSAWSELAARHPDIAARLRARPAPAPAAGASAAPHQPHAAWARKRRPASQDGVDDFGSGFDHFDRFPFEDIPPEFREHFPSHWSRRFGPRDEPPPPQPRATSPPHQPPPAPPQQQSTSTQTEAREPLAEQPQSLPQYGLRNTVDLGQKSPADPSLVDVDGRNQRCMSAPPDSRLSDRSSSSTTRMSGPGQPPEQEHAPSHVRHIPIFVEGRDEPVINKNVDHQGAHVPPPPDRPAPYHDERDGPAGFQHPPNFSRPFGAPFNRQGFRQGPQPFVQQKVYPQNAFARANSPQRSQSPKPDEHYVKVPVHHEQSAPKADHAPSRAQQPHRPPPQQAPRAQTPPQQSRSPPPPPPPPPQPQQPAAAGTDPISVILNIQTDVLNLMTEVENFAGTKNDKKYLFLDEMLTRNLIKLDNIETDGKENVRQARKEAIRCIQKCIAVLEAKADSNAASGVTTAPAEDVDMNDTDAGKADQNGEVSTTGPTKEPAKPEDQAQNEPAQQNTTDEAAAAVQEPEQTKPKDDNDASPKPAKGANKGAKKRDKSKDKKEATTAAEAKDNADRMSVDEKGDKSTDSQTMDVEAVVAAPSQ